MKTHAIHGSLHPPYKTLRNAGFERTRSASASSKPTAAAVPINLLRPCWRSTNATGRASAPKWRRSARCRSRRRWAKRHWPRPATTCGSPTATCAAFARPLLLVVGGLMGTGKSTLAAALAEQFACQRISTDLVRLELFGPTAQPAGYDEGTYQPAHRERVYDELFIRAGRMLTDGSSVVLDGTFLRAGFSNRAASLAEQHAADLLHVRCQCPDDVAQRRIADRAAAGGDPSEARPELYHRQKSQLEALPSRLPHVVVEHDRRAGRADGSRRRSTPAHATAIAARCAVTSCPDRVAPPYCRPRVAPPYCQALTPGPSPTWSTAGRGEKRASLLTSHSSPHQNLSPHHNNAAPPASGRATASRRAPAVGDCPRRRRSPR